MATLRVLQVIHTLEFAGAQRFVADLVGQATDGVEWLVVGLSPPDSLVPELREKGVGFVEILASSRRDPRVVAKLRRLVLDRDVRVVHAHGIIPPFWAALALRGLNVPLIVGVNSQPSQVQWAGRRLIRPVVFRRADAIVCASKAVADELAALYPCARGKIQVIYNCVNPDRLRPSRSRQQVRRELGVPADAPLICNIANVRKLKGQHYLVPALAQVRRRHPDAHLIVAGSLREKEAVDAVRRLIADLGLSDAVKLLGMRPDVPDLVAASDVFVLSSTTECLPVSIAEAMVIGTPVVATDVGGVSELVLDGHTGLLVPPRSPQALADAILRILASADLAARLRENARRHIRQIASVDNVRAAHVELYRRVLARRGVSDAPAAQPAPPPGDEQ